MIKAVHPNDLDLLSVMSSVQDSATKRRVVAQRIKLATSASVLNRANL